MPKLPERSDPTPTAPSLRANLSDDGMPSKQKRYPKALEGSPSERLAINGQGQGEVNGALGPVVRLVAGLQETGREDGFIDRALGKPDVRLALAAGQAEREGNPTLEAPIVRLVGQSDGGANTSILPKAFTEERQPPALLVSYVYLEKFLNNRQRYHYRDWMMDSGAFSAYNSGSTIDIEEYCRTCLRLFQEDPTLTEVVALDVIGSGEGSLKNAWRMRELGVEAMPVFHIGDDWAILKEYCQNWDKVGLSCRFGEPLKKSYWFYDQCFARCWPHKFHSFGWVEEKMLLRYPFHSSDSSSWETGPCAFGRWAYFGKLSIRGSQQNLRSQVDYYLEMERKLRERWKKEMLALEAKTPIATRLVVGTGRSVTEIGFQALNQDRSTGAPDSSPPAKKRKKK